MRSGCARLRVAAPCLVGRLCRICAENLPTLCDCVALLPPSQHVPSLLSPCRWTTKWKNKKKKTTWASGAKDFGLDERWWKRHEPYPKSYNEIPLALAPCDVGRLHCSRPPAVPAAHASASCYKATFFLTACNDSWRLPSRCNLQPTDRLRNDRSAGIDAHRVTSG